jgi:hypothetical protein
VILNRARPTLLVPYAGSFGGTFEHVLLARDDMRRYAASPP